MKIGRNCKKWMTRVLVVVMMVTCLPEFGYSKAEAAKNEYRKKQISTQDKITSVSATNSFGKLLQDPVSEQAEEQEENNGYNVFSVEIQDKTAHVSMETVEDCILIVGIYEEDGIKMLATGKREVTQEEREVELNIEIDEMPQYYLVRAFLLETNTLNPLCSEYETPMYTKEMQDFLSKTTDDFEGDRVLNLDEDKTNNFAVYDENTKIICGDDNSNRLKCTNEERQEYMIENADTSALSLSKGDIFAYERENEEVIIVKVQSVSVTGSTVTVNGKDAELEDVFEYVKIDETATTEDMEVDSSTCSEGVEYQGKKNDSVGRTRAISGEGSSSVSLAYRFTGEKSPLSGKVKLSITTSLKVYISFQHQYLEYKSDYSLVNDWKLELKGEAALKLGEVVITPVPGIYIKLTPSFLVEAETSAGIVGTIKGCIGYSASPQDGFKNLTSSPKLNEETTEINIEGSIFVGFSLEPSISIVTEKLVKASAEAKVGLELTLSKNYLESLDSATEKHECSNCFEGEIHAKGEISASLKFFDDESLEVSAKKEMKFKICDIYWCIQHGKFEFSSCPYHQYKVTVIAKNPDGTLVNEATVNGDFQTNSRGEAYLWFARGKHKLSVSKNGEDKVTKTVDVVDKARKVTVTFKTNSVVDDGTGGSEDEEDSEKDWLENNPLAGKKIKDISLNGYNCGILTTNGELYSWGYGMVSHRTPTKILSDVKEMQMCDSNLSVALLNNGDLYMWGYLDGRLGGACIDYSSSPTKVLSNVESFKVAGFYDEICYALTKSHELYVWGADDPALGKTPDNTKPYKVLDDVVYADIEEVDDYRPICAAIKSTGELYMWGANDTGVLGEIELDDDGDRKTIYSWTPKKIMEHVVNVKLSQGYCTALTNSGDLYTWGDNSYGQLGNGNNISTHIPQKILSDIVEYDVAGPLAGAINNNGDLYMWGNPYSIDDESDEPELILTPHKIMSKTKKLYLDTYINAVISQDNKLYTWGFDFENSEFDKILSPQYLFDDVIDCDIDSDTLGIITKTNDLYMCGGIPYIYNYNGSYFGGICLKKPTQINVVHPAIKTSSKKQGKVVQKTTDISNVALESFEDLDANATYNYYILKSKDTEDILSGNNLLYIGQGTTDSSGHLRTAYEMKEACDEPIILLKKLEKDNITDAKILISDLIYNKQEQYINPTVTYKGETLEEGKDYELSGDFSASEIGTYTVTICGIGNYTGLVDKTFNISCSHQFGDWIITKEPTDVDVGTKKRVCSICEYAEEETISKLPSTYGKKESKPKLPSIYGKKVKKPGKVTGLKVKNKKKNKIIVSWKWKTSVSGFQIQYAQNKKFTKKKKSKMVGGWTSLKIITKLKKGKTYYVRVRAYKKSSGKKIYGKWSKIKKIKIRK